MKKTGLLITVVLLFCLAVSGLNAQNNRNDRLRIKVLTYNIYGGRNTDQSRNLDRIATVIKTLNPDIVALQEVDRHTGRLNGIDLAAELGKRTGMQHVFGKAMKYDGGEYGEAILSRLPIESVTNHLLPTVPLSDENEKQEVEPRAALAVKLKFPETDQAFIFIGTHLDHLRDPVNKIAQAHGLNKIVESYQGMPVILGGDLNATPDSEPMRILQDVWTDSWPSKKEVFAPRANQRRRNRRIDYVIYTPENKWRVVNTYRATEIKRNDNEWQDLLALASDHLPVMAELELR